MSEANKIQIGGEHYKKAGKTGEEHWDRVARLDLDYWQAAATKYVERCDEKNGIQDMEKAIHYLQKRIELAKAGMLPGWRGERYKKDLSPQKAPSLLDGIKYGGRTLEAPYPDAEPTSSYTNQDRTG